MNNDRRKKIAQLVVDLENLRQGIESLRDEEQEYYDNMPEGLQAGSKGEAAESAVGALEYAMEDIESACSNLQDIE